MRQPHEKTYDQTWMDINAIFQNNMTTEGKVTGIETINYKDNQTIPCLTVLVEGKVKGIIPAPEIDQDMTMADAIKFQRHMRKLVGNYVPFKILKVDRSEDPGVCILSRKKALKEIRESTWELLKEKELVSADVIDVLSHTCRLDIGGIETIMHASEVGHGWITDVRDHLRVGDEITVMVTKLDKENKTLEVSRKATLTDRWLEVSDLYKVNNEYLGTITGIRDYGVFINLQDNIDALLPLPPAAVIRDKMDIGQEALVKIIKINAEKRQIQGRIVKIIL